MSYKEIFLDLPIEGFANYQVSNKGRIKRKAGYDRKHAFREEMLISTILTKNKKRKDAPEKLVCVLTGEDSIAHGPKSKTFSVKMLVYIAFVSFSYNYRRECIYHRNSNPEDCSAENLYSISKRDSSSRERALPMSGYRGVSELPDGCFEASKSFDGRSYYIGYFANPRDAHEAYLSFSEQDCIIAQEERRSAVKNCHYDKRARKWYAKYMYKREYICLGSFNSEQDAVEAVIKSKRGKGL